MRRKTRSTFSFSLRPVIHERFERQADIQQTDMSKLLDELLENWLDEQEEKQREPGTPAIE